MDMITAVAVQGNWSEGVRGNWLSNVKCQVIDKPGKVLTDVCPVTPSSSNKDPILKLSGHPKYFSYKPAKHEAV